MCIFFKLKPLAEKIATPTPSGISNNNSRSPLGERNYPLSLWERVRVRAVFN
jgi:hypothetical protein